MKSATDRSFDVAVIGEHPAAYFAAALLAGGTGAKGGRGEKLAVLHIIPPRVGKPPDRLVWINPALFALSPLLATLSSTLSPAPVFGMEFLGEQPGLRSSYRAKSPVAQVVSYAALRKAIAAIAKAAGVRCAVTKQLGVESVDETGVLLRTGRTTVHAKLLVMSDGCPAGRAAMLGLHDHWGTGAAGGAGGAGGAGRAGGARGARGASGAGSTSEAGILRRYTIARCPRSALQTTTELPLIYLAPNLDGLHHFAWLFPGPTDLQLMVEQPATTTAAARGFAGGFASTHASSPPAFAPAPLIRHWIQQLQSANILNASASIIAGANARFSEITLPAGGALVEEAVGNRTLLIGPAGGFVSACGEEIYPGCWSALFADKVARKALRDRHPQDALQPYRHTWRTTLGQYLRGPRENLPLLLSLVYKNAALTNRLAEAILNGKPVVR